MTTANTAQEALKAAFGEHSEPESEERQRDPGTGRFLKAEAAPAEAAPAPAGDFTLRYKGRDLQFDGPKVRQLAQQGLDYTEKMTALKADTAGYQAYRDYVDYLKENQELSNRVSDMLQFYEDTKRLPRIVVEGGEITDHGEELSGNYSKDQAWKQKVEQRFEQSDREDAAHELAGQLDAAIENNPNLKALREHSLKVSGGEKDMALHTLGKMFSEEVARDPEADLGLVAKALDADAPLYGIGAPGAASEVETMGADPYMEQKRNAASAFRSESPTGGGQAAPSEEATEFTSKDLHNGAVARGAINHLQAMIKAP